MQDPAWEIPPAARAVIPDALIRLIVERDEEDRPRHEPRVRIAAAQALIAMNRQNQTHAERDRDDSQPLDADDQGTRLAALARRLDAGALAADARDADPASAARATDRAGDEEARADQPG
jgi:hypothetical protein